MFNYDTTLKFNRKQKDKHDTEAIEDFFFFE